MVTQACDQAGLHETVSKRLKKSKRQAGFTSKVYYDAYLVFQNRSNGLLHHSEWTPEFLPGPHDQMLTPVTFFSPTYRAGKQLLRQTISSRHGPFSLIWLCPPNTGTGHLASLSLCSNLKAAGCKKNAPATLASVHVHTVLTLVQWHILYHCLPLHGKLHISVSYFHFCIPWHTMGPSKIVIKMLNVIGLGI